MLESLNYSFRNKKKHKKHNLSNLPHQTVEKLQKNHGVLRGPQLGKQRRRARLGILRVKTARHWKQVTLLCCYYVTARFSLFPTQRIRRTEPEATEQHQRFWQDSHGTSFRQREVRHSLLRSSPERHGRTNRCVQWNIFFTSHATHTSTTTFWLFLPAWHLATRHDISFKGMATTR